LPAGWDIAKLWSQISGFIFRFRVVSKMMINNKKNLAKFGYKGDMKSKTLKHLSILSLPTKNHIYKSADFYANSLKIW
jgi:hypothetical protein